jgi:hypothetical protein
MLSFYLYKEMDFSQKNPNFLQSSDSLGARCEPSQVLEAAKCLSGEAKDVVRRCGFGAILDMKVKKFHSLETLIVLMHKCDVSSTADESFTIVISEDRKMPVTFEVVRKMFGIPAGKSTINDKDWDTELDYTKTHSEFTKTLKDLGYLVLTRSKGKESSSLRVGQLKKYMSSVKDKHEKLSSTWRCALK